jgi:adenosylmethionine-8-amino-7-oxononanoate aminotransferase
MNELQAKDLKYVWHPCSQMKDYAAFPPIVIDRGEGVYLYDIDGNSYLDAVSSWWVNLFGHSNKRINQAIARQLDKLEHSIFANFTHEPAIELAERMVNISPPGLAKVFFSDDGSTAVEVALKISFQYFQQSGKARKQKFVAVQDSYHGETLGAMSVNNIDLYSKIYKPLLVNTYKVEGPDCYRCKYDLNRENCEAQCFEHMEKCLQENHAEIAGAIIEPMVQGAAGMKIYSPEYLRKLRKACDDYDIHFIADEIAVGFGRTGKMWGCEHAGVAPDIMCVSKGLTAGYLPLALTLTTDKIYAAFYDDYTSLKAFLDSHSYTGNPTTCALANETLNIFEDENILDKNQLKSKIIGEKIQELLIDHSHVDGFRQLGMISAIEIVKDKKTKAGFDWQQRVGYQIYQIALKHGVLLRPLGNVMYFLPPYIINEEQIDKMIRVARRSIDEYFACN